MASDVPVLLSDGHVRLDPTPDHGPAVKPRHEADQGDNSGPCWTVSRLGGPDPIGTVCLAPDPSPHRRRLTISWDAGVPTEGSSSADIQTMSEAVRLACQWAFNSEGVVVIAWLGPTSATLRTVMHQAGFRIHPLPWRAALDYSGTPQDAWYADLSAGDPTEATGMGLTAREHHVLSHMARGRSNAEIAEQLGISQNTVKNHVRSILEHLQAPSRTAAVVIALQSGLVSLAGPSGLPPA